MDSIYRSKEQNTGGIELIKFAPVEWILDIPVPINHEIPDEIAFAGGTGWLSIVPVKNSGSWRENESEDENGLMYEQVIQLQINKTSLPNQQVLDALARRRLVMLIYDNNYRESGVPPVLAGNSENWLSFSRSRNSGRQPSELNHYAISFAGRSPYPAPYYTFES